MKEIAYLESVERPRISAAIAEARDKGDLSENSEYDAAKEAQGMLEMKISQLKDMLARHRNRIRHRAERQQEIRDAQPDERRRGSYRGAPIKNP